MTSFMVEMLLILFQSVGKYVLIETQHLQKSKEQTSAASQTRKEKAKKEVSDLVKFVIRQADKRKEQQTDRSSLAQISQTEFFVSCKKSHNLIFIYFFFFFYYFFIHFFIQVQR